MLIGLLLDCSCWVKCNIIIMIISSNNELKVTTIFLCQMKCTIIKAQGSLFYLNVQNNKFNLFLLLLFSMVLEVEIQHKFLRYLDRNVRHIYSLRTDSPLFIHFNSLKCIFDGNFLIYENIYFKIHQERIQEKKKMSGCWAMKCDGQKFQRLFVLIKPHIIL